MDILFSRAKIFPFIMTLAYGTTFCSAAFFAQNARAQSPAVERGQGAVYVQPRYQDYANVTARSERHALQPTKTNKSASEIWSQFFFGAPKKQAPKEQPSFDRQAANRNEALVQPNPDSASILRQFFGLPPETPSQTTTARPLKAQNYVFNDPGNYSHSYAELSQNIQSQISRNVHQLSSNASQNMRAAQAQGRQYAEQISNDLRGASNAVAQNARELQNRGRRYAQNAQNQFHHEANRIFNEVDDVAASAGASLQRAARQASEQTSELANVIEMTSDELANARRRRLEELNAYLAANRPVEFAQRIRESREFNEERDFDVAQANRSKIRQASDVVPQVLPARPQILEQMSRSPRAVTANALPQSNTPLPEVSRVTPNAMPGTTRKITNSAPPAQNVYATKPTPRATAIFSAPILDEETQEEEYEDYIDESEEPRDVVKNGVIRSSAKFIDPRDL
ncbi:MAG: hypothetical protein ACOX0A_04230 [Thermoguttaceae bacterium]|jgi:hypothetical protein